MQNVIKRRKTGFVIRQESGISSGSFVACYILLRPIPTTVQYFALELDIMSDRTFIDIYTHEE